MSPQKRALQDRRTAREVFTFAFSYSSKCQSPTNAVNLELGHSRKVGTSWFFPGFRFHVAPEISWESFGMWSCLPSTRSVMVAAVCSSETDSSGTSAPEPGFS